MYDAFFIAWHVLFVSSAPADYDLGEWKSYNTSALHWGPCVETGLSLTPKILRTTVRNRMACFRAASRPPPLVFPPPYTHTRVPRFPWFFGLLLTPPHHHGKTFWHHGTTIFLSISYGQLYVKKYLVPLLRSFAQIYGEDHTRHTWVVATDATGLDPSLAAEFPFVEWVDYKKTIPKNAYREMDIDKLWFMEYYIKKNRVELSAQTVENDDRFRDAKVA
eukprot:GEMP01097804.1.p1 GENE.GEMP01097804.1~~GEMP01097804.1.p1  ORF type:complete len:219 (+),score=26.50 GEMP01097804.1:105-761(+)